MSFLIFVLWATSAQFAVLDATAGGSSASGGHKIRLWAADWGPKTPDKASKIKSRLKVNGVADTCLFEASPALDSFLLYTRGPKDTNCTFQEKIEQAISLGAAGVLVKNYDDSIFPMGSNGTFTSSIPAFMISRTDGDKLEDAAKTADVKLEIWEYQRGKKTDESMFCMGVLAVFCVWLGAEASYIAARKSMDRTGDDGLSSSLVDPLPEVVVPDMQDGLGFIVLAGVMLTVLYFVIDYLIWIIIGFFAISGSLAFAHFINGLIRNKLCKQLPAYQANALAIVLGLGVGAVWAVYRKSNWAWVLQNILCIALLVHIQLAVQIESMRVAACLLSCAFFYDIFMVFGTPYLTKGTSVMERVAMGGSTGEALPMLLSWPRLRDEFGGMARLGLGDVALPGMFISFLKRYDPISGVSGYYWVGMMGYTVGLGICFFALIVMNLAQPALLWLVPCILIPIGILAFSRGEFNKIWTGKPLPGPRSTGYVQLGTRGVSPQPDEKLE